MNESNKDIIRAGVVDALAQTSSDVGQEPFLVVEDDELFLMDDVMAAAKLSHLGIPIPERIAADAAKIVVMPTMCSVEDVDNVT